MKRNKLNSEQISALCMELSLLVHAGVGVGDGLSLLAEEADCLEDRAMLTRMAGQVDEGASLAEALRSSGCFPDYVASLAEVGQRSGHMEEALTALAEAMPLYAAGVGWLAPALMGAAVGLAVPARK